MAYQRPFLISLKRSDSSNKWGFGVSGGSDYGRPLVVQTVLEDSIAERCGLREGDEIIQVGRVNIQDLALIKVQELLARCGNKIEMFVIREDLLSPRKGKEPSVVKAVVHNPYNSPLSLYSTENIADTLAKQTEVLTEGHVSTDEEEGPENLTFKQKSAVFHLLEEQAKQESLQKSRGSPIKKPNAAPPPPPIGEINGYSSPEIQQYTNSKNLYQDSRTQGQADYHSERIVNKYQQQQQPVQYQQTSVYQSSYQYSPEQYQQTTSVVHKQPVGYQSTVSSYQTSYQQQNQSNYKQANQSNYLSSSTPKSPTDQRAYQTSYQQINQSDFQQRPKSPVDQSRHQTTTYQQLNQSNFQQRPKSPADQSRHQTTTYQQTNQSHYQQQNRQPQQTAHSQQQYKDQNSQQTQQSINYSQARSDQKQISSRQSSQQKSTAVSKAEIKLGPPPPPRVSSTQKDTSNMTAIYKQQYEQHLQQYYDQQQALQNSINAYDDYDQKPRAHIISENIFENTSTSGTPITYKAPPSAPPKPHWPPAPQDEQYRRSPSPPSAIPIDSIWPPKKSTATDLPKTGFNPAAVREQGSGRRCVWPPVKPEEEMRSGRTTPQSPMPGRRIHWNPSPSPPSSRRVVFGASHSQSPSRRKDIVWPPTSPTQNKENIFYKSSPRMSRKARFDEYVTQHASINVPQTYRPPPGTQHVEFY